MDQTKYIYQISRLIKIKRNLRTKIKEKLNVTLRLYLSKAVGFRRKKN